MPRELVKVNDREFAAALGANLARLRRAKGMSQEDLGFRSEVHRTVISKIERGEEIGRADTALKLSVGLGVSPSALFAGIGWAAPVLTKRRPLLGNGSAEASPGVER